MTERRRATDKSYHWTNLLGFVLIVVSLLWKFGIGEASDMIFVLVFGFGCFLLSKDNFVAFLEAWKKRLGGGQSS